ncbi:thiolase-like protein [Mycena olivaceomarginata]|nr:thiolase-like protein [Mycena olivaceomarginata]
MNGDCDSALVGGVNIISSPDMFLGLDRGHFLSPTGQCKSFDASADGYSRSEGCGMLLKCLRDAEAENDTILGVIRGVEVNQTALFRRVLDKAGINPARVNVEAHGTGMQAGDPNEVVSLRSVLMQGVDRSAALHIGSVKANIGHLEAASGAAGLANLALMLRHKHIPRQISLQTLNPLIAPLEEDGVIDRVDAEWVPSHAGMLRVALLNNFGAAGANTAVLFVFGLSAKTLPALEEFRTNYMDWLRSSESANVPLMDIAYTATARRQIYSCRLAVSACTRTELLEKLESVAVVQVQHPSTPPAQAISVFSGQGSQCLSMGRRLYDDFLLFRRCIDECQHILISSGFPHSMLPIIRETGGLTTWEAFEAYQVAIFALESPDEVSKTYLMHAHTPECPTHLVEEDLVPALELDVHTGVVNAFLWGEKGVNLVTHHASSSPPTPTLSTLSSRSPHLLTIDPYKTRGGNKASLYEATFALTGGPLLNVFMKTYPVEDFDLLLHEFDVYIAVAHLVIVPKLYADLELTRQEKLDLYDALRQLHAAGVVHGDVAARNILRRPSGAFCLADFDRSSLNHVCPGPVCEELAQFQRDLGLEAV